MLQLKCECGKRIDQCICNSCLGERVEHAIFGLPFLNIETETDVCSICGSKLYNEEIDNCSKCTAHYGRIIQ